MTHCCLGNSAHCLPRLASDWWRPPPNWWLAPPFSPFCSETPTPRRSARRRLGGTRGVEGNTAALGSGGYKYTCASSSSPIHFLHQPPNLLRESGSSFPSVFPPPPHTNTMDSVPKQEYRIRDLPTKSVTLFPTRAQIVREIKDVTLRVRSPPPFPPINTPTNTHPSLAPTKSQSLA